MKRRVTFPLAVATTHTRRPWSRPTTPATAPMDAAAARAEAERRSRLLTMAELGAYLRYTGSDPGHSAYNYVKTHDLPIIKRGTLILIRLGVIDDHLEQQRKDIAGRALAAMGRR